VSNASGTTFDNSSDWTLANGKEIEEPDVDEYLLPYTQHVFRRGGQEWVIFSLHALAETPHFLQAAV